LAQNFGRLSPSPCWVYAATGLTGTGPDAYHRLEAAAQKTESAFTTLQRNYWKTSPESHDYPRFTAEELPLVSPTTATCAQAVNDALNDVLLLIILNVVFFMLSFAFFLRYDVR